MSGMPELGSKISLISKADIRYEGRLFTVDPNECTIALANVRSFGTEDRDTQFQIAPQSQIYDYILFRGTDIKDIRIVNSPQIPNDPAIMQMHLPNQMGQNQFQNSPFPVVGQVMPPIANQMGQLCGPYGPMGNMSVLQQSNSNGLAPGSGMPQGLNQKMSNMNKQPSELNAVIPDTSSANVTTNTSSTTNAERRDQASVLDLIAGGSRSTTPISLNSRKSPTTDMGVQVNQHNKDGQRRNNNQRQGNNMRDRRDSGKGGDHLNNQDNRNQRNIHHHGGNQNRGGWALRGNNTRGGRPRGGPRNNGPNQSGYRSSGGMPNQNKGRPMIPYNTNPKHTIKFDSDYDFEQANTKFEELTKQLSKLKVGDENEAKIVDQVNGEADKKDDSGNETGAGEHEQEEDDTNGSVNKVNVGYDKTKSFFDNISCEAAQDRSKNKSRNDWRHERKLNSETFGISSTRRAGFTGYRPRGGGGGYYNNRGNSNNSGGNGHNGFRGGYRQNNYRGRNNRQQSQSTGIPQQPKNPQNQPNAQPPQSSGAVQQPSVPVAVAAGGK